MGREHHIQILIVDKKPEGEGISPGALYLVKEEGKTNAQLYRANRLGTEVLPFHDNDETIRQIKHFGPERPEEGSGFLLWYDGSSLFYNARRWGLDNWTKVGPVPARWHMGGATPDSNLGSEGDFYAKHNGDVFKKESSGWVYQTSIRPEPNGIRATTVDEIPELATQEAGAHEFMIVRGRGMYVHEPENYDGIDNEFYLASANGRWKLESVSVDFLDYLLANFFNRIVDDDPLIELSPLYDALHEYEQKKGNVRIIRKQFRPPLSSVGSSGSFTLAFPEAEIGDSTFLNPLHAVHTFTCINSYILRKGEVVVNVSHDGSYGGSFTITADWICILVKQA